MHSVKLEFLSEDKLCRTTWEFFLLGKTLYVDVYTEEKRATLRHKFKEVASWSRLPAILSCTLTQGKVPFTDEIAMQAKEALIEKVRSEVRVGFQTIEA
jgi:hypothetical protein